MLTDMRVLVTGAAGGVGRALVQSLVAEGARVCATDITPGVMELEATGEGRVAAVAADVSLAVDVAKVFRIARERFGGVDALVSNAGAIVTKPVHETTEEEWDRVLDSNAKALFLTAREAIPEMLQRGRGVIVATGSISSVVGLPAQAAYCASKGALLQLVRQMAVDYAAYGIRVNAVGPGSIDTPFLTQYLDGLPDPAAGLADIKAAHPMGRIAQPQEVADAIVYLLGPKSSFVTGQILMVDGGYAVR
jgi:NAD(P)-dependent dehydrogenase (short-subunit alcohol dehydrogenase family)